MIYRVKARLKHINKDQHDNHCASRHSTWPACWVSDHVPPRNKMIINNLYLSEVEFSAKHHQPNFDLIFEDNRPIFGRKSGIFL